VQKVSGNEISKEIIARLKNLPSPKKNFSAILVGNDPVSLNFLKEKGKIAESLGIAFTIHNFSADSTEAELRREIKKIGADKHVGGVIIQLPLPKGIDRHAVLNVVPPEKDVDVLGELAIGAFYNGHNYVVPPSVATVEEIINYCKIDLSKSNVAVVGLGLLIGRPIATWLMNRCQNLMLIGKNADIKQIKHADLVISGVGKGGLITPGMLKDGASVIDFGYDYSSGKLAGDLDTSDIKALEKLSFYTPTPGGTGPILISELFENFYKLNGGI